MNNTNLTTVRFSKHAQQLAQFTLRRFALRRSLPVLTLSLMVPALLLPAQQASAFSYDDPNVPGVTGGVAATSNLAKYSSTDPTPVTATGADLVSVNNGMSPTTIKNTIEGATDGQTIVFSDANGGVYTNLKDIKVTNRVTIRAAQNAKVWLDGAEAVPTAAWNRIGTSSIWWTSSVGFEFPPQVRDISVVNPTTNAQADDGEMVFVKDIPQVQVDAVEATPPVVPSLSAGRFAVDRRNKRIYIHSAATPGATGNKVEITDSGYALELNSSGILLSGLNFRRFSTTNNDAAVVVTAGSVGNGVLVDRCSFFWNASFGLCLKGNSAVALRNKSVSNGCIGIKLGGNFTKAQGNYVAWNNAEGFATTNSTGGIRTGHADDAIICDNFVENNKCSQIWVDYSPRVKVFRNYVKGGALIYNTSNLPTGIFMEISPNMASAPSTEACTVAFNLITGNRRGIQNADSAWCKIYNNTLYNNEEQIYINDGGAREGINQLPANGAVANNIMLGNSILQLDAYGGGGIVSSARFTTLNHNVYRESGTLINWKPNANPVRTYSIAQLGAFRTDTGFEINSLTRPNTLFFNAGTRDFRISNTDSAGTSNLTPPADVRALTQFGSPFYPYALSTSDLNAAALDALGLESTPNTTNVGYRGAFKPAAPPAARTTTSSAPSGGTG